MEAKVKDKQLHAEVAAKSAAVGERFRDLLASRVVWIAGFVIMY